MSWYLYAIIGNGEDLVYVCTELQSVDIMNCSKNIGLHSCVGLYLGRYLIQSWCRQIFGD